MKNLKLASLLLAASTILSLTSIKTADAAWVKNSTGWWNTEGNSWSIGWRCIDNEWYFFNTDGYMMTGWVKNCDKWYYLYDNGSMAKNTTTDGYALSGDGSWIEAVQEQDQINNQNSLSSNSQDDADSASQNNEDENFNSDDFIESLKSKGYDVKIKDTSLEDAYLDIASWSIFKAPQQIITLNDNENIQIYQYDNNEKMEEDSHNVDADGFGYNSPDEKIDYNGFTCNLYPHFYKKGSIIVEYCGRNNLLIDDIKNIIGEEFAGYKDISDLSNEEIIKKICEQLDSKEQNEIKSSKKLSLSMERIYPEDWVNDDSYPYKVQYVLHVQTETPNYCSQKNIRARIDNYKPIR